MINHARARQKKIYNPRLDNFAIELRPLTAFFPANLIRV